MGINLRIFSFLVFITICSFGQEVKDSVSSTNTEQHFIMTKSPMGAILRSAVLPGWGQYYNQSYWKIPIVIGALGGISYGYLFYQNKYSEFRDKYKTAIETDDPRAEEYLSSREFYKDNRDQMAVYFGLAYALNLLDAYIDAHLFDFDVSDNLATGSAQINLRFNLPL